MTSTALSRKRDISKSRFQDLSAVLFVSTSLDVWETHTPTHYARDLVINETPYRKLDPDYYAWLRDRMSRVKTRLDRGKFSQAAYDNLRERFNRIHHWAVAQFGEPALIQAVQIFGSSHYQPPKSANTDCFQGIKGLPASQQDWPPAFRKIWNEIVRDLTRLGVSQENAQGVAQGIVDSLVGKPTVPVPHGPEQAALPL